MPRAVSAVVLAVVAIGATWAGPVSFAVLVAVIGLLLSWEWSRIVRGNSVDVLFGLHAASVLVAVVLAASGRASAAVLTVLGGTALMLAMAPRERAGLSSFGVTYVGMPAIAFVWLRGGDGLGLLAILFVFAIVWTTDTFAYLCGRLIGGAKLWPAVSPGKTWSGTIGGLVFAAIAGAIFAVTLVKSGPVALALVGLVLSVVAQIGDLGESALKRAFAVKNSSELIPGHGGFMDRLDGAVTAACLAAVIAAMRWHGSPAEALLKWP